MYTATGEAHGLVNTLTNSVENNEFKHMTPQNKAKLEKEKKEDNRIEKYEYINRTGRHERLSKPYCRYAGDPILMYNLIPGRVYDLPVGFAKEVNDMKNMKRSGLLEVDGKEINRDGSPLVKDEEAEWVHKLVKAG
jgi:hypothetical protein